MFKKYVLAIILICATLFTIYYIQKRPVTTMKYFPIDESHFFETATTSINYLTNNDTNNIQWITESTSSAESYLRQDISLLFENGRFKGIQNKWRQNVTNIMLKQSFQKTKSSLLETISFHHAEIHYKDKSIKSIQKMSEDRLYFIHNHEMKAFHKPSTNEGKTLAKTLNDTTETYLTKKWNAMIEHYDIQKNNYIEIPLTEIFQFNEKPIPGLSMEKTEQIIGQLWEGMYDNYIILLSDKQEQRVHHSVPLILMAKDNSHLLVLFEINDNKYKLIQKYPN